MSQISATLIISFYREIERLRMVLASLERQSFSDFEVIVADDGSPQDIVQKVKSYAERSPLKLIHVWQEDNGFRKTRILNEAVRTARGSYLIFIDGDCIPHFRFIEDHVNARERKVLLAGRRVNLSQRLTTRLSEESIRAGHLESSSFALSLFWDGAAGNTGHFEKGVRIKSPFLRRFLNQKMAGVLGCNFSMHAEDLKGINGFDERYQAPAYGEDLDIETRFQWHGGVVRMLKNLAVQYHLFHPKLPHRLTNKPIYEQVLSERKAFTPYGLVHQEK